MAPVSPLRLPPLHATQALPERGTYIVWLWLPKAVRLPVPRPEGVALRPGLYAYTGSAQVALAARLARHIQGAGRRRPRWHIDYLRRYAMPVGADVWPRSGKVGECRLAAALLEGSPPGVRRVAGFGASDCRCGGHLIDFSDASAPPRAFGLPASLEPALRVVCRRPLPGAPVPEVAPVLRK